MPVYPSGTSTLTDTAAASIRADVRRSCFWQPAKSVRRSRRLAVRALRPDCGLIDCGSTTGALSRCGLEIELDIPNGLERDAVWSPNSAHRDSSIPQCGRRRICAIYGG
jgi:hypothetical protein